MTDPMRQLDLMLLDMEQAESSFRPTNFWASGLATIIEDLRSLGFGGFRNHPSATRFYVPVYARSAWRSHRRLVVFLERMLNRLSHRGVGSRLVEEIVRGRQDARADYRVFRAADPPGGLPLWEVEESEWGGGERFEFDGRRYSKSMLNYLRGLAFLKKQVDTTDLSSALEIGGGYGTLGEILLQSRPDGFYLNVDIPPVAAVSTYYLRQRFGPSAVLDYEASREMEVLDVEALRARYRCAVICPWQLPRVQGRLDLFVNFMSFQEMEPAVVANYVRLVQPLIRDFALLRNRRHGKKVVAREGQVGVMEPTRLHDMVALFDQFDLLASDAEVFGDVGRDGRSISEVACLARGRQPPFITR